MNAPRLSHEPKRHLVKVSSLQDRGIPEIDADIGVHRRAENKDLFTKPTAGVIQGSADDAVADWERVPRIQEEEVDTIAHGRAQIAAQHQVVYPDQVIIQTTGNVEIAADVCSAQAEPVPKDRWEVVQRCSQHDNEIAADPQGCPRSPGITVQIKYIEVRSALEGQKLADIKFMGAHGNNFVQSIAQDERSRAANREIGVLSELDVIGACSAGDCQLSEDIAAAQRNCIGTVAQIK